MIPDRLLEEKEVEELMIRLNRNHGEFDYDVLANVFDIPCLLDYGFNVDELELDLKNMQTEDKPGEPDPKVKTCPNCGHQL